MENMDFAGRRILVASLLPDTGHLTPLMQMGENLRAHGAVVHVIVPAEARTFVERFGFPTEYLEPVIPDNGKTVLSRYSRAGELSRLLVRGPLFMSNYIIPLTASGVGQLDRLVERARAFGPELILADSHLFSQEYEELASRCDCPLVLNCSKGNHYYCQPESTWSQNRHPLVLKGRALLQRLASPLHYKFDRVFRSKALAHRLSLGNYVKKMRATYQSKQGEPARVHQITSGLGLIEARYLGERIPLLDEKVKLFGVLEPKASWAASADLLEWLDRDPEKPVVYMAFGTMVAPSYPLIERAVKAVLKNNSRLLLASRNQPKLPSELVDREEFCWRPWAPQTAVLSHPAVVGFISHAGATSVQETLWYGKPILCIPSLWDQFYCSWVAEQLGFGIWADGTGSPPLPIEAKVDRLLTDSSLRENAVRLSRELHDEKGDQLITAELHSLLHATEGSLR